MRALKPGLDLRELCASVAMNSGNSASELEAAVLAGSVPICERGLPAFGAWAGWKAPVRSANLAADPGFALSPRPDERTPTVTASADPASDARRKALESAARQLGLDPAKVLDDAGSAAPLQIKSGR